jgi:hypothetical protein
MISKLMIYLSLPYRILLFGEGVGGGGDENDDAENNNMNSASNNSGVLNQSELKFDSTNYYGCAA